MVSAHRDPPDALQGILHPLEVPKSVEVEYKFEGKSHKGYFSRGDFKGAAQPGVLVVHDAGGLSENTKEKTRRLASLGYAAFALDLWGNGELITDYMPRIQALAGDIPRWRAVTLAGLRTLSEQPNVDISRLAAIGYCFGGTTVYELARSGADVKAVVGFHSGLVPSSGEARNIKGKVLTLIGADDPLISPEARLVFEKEMREAKVDYQMNIYGNTGHSFTNPEATAMNRPGFAYNAEADARSWEEMKRLFTEVFKQKA